MDPATLGTLIPVLAVGGFFAWLIALAAGRAYTAKLQAQARAPSGPGPGHDEILAALEELRREVAELAERVDFTERLLAKGREGERLAPP